MQLHPLSFSSGPDNAIVWDPLVAIPIRLMDFRRSGEERMVHLWHVPTAKENPLQISRLVRMHIPHFGRMRENREQQNTDNHD